MVDMKTFKEQILDTSSIVDCKKRAEVLWLIAMQMVYKMALCECHENKK